MIKDEILTEIIQAQFYLPRHFRTIATSDMMPTARPTSNDATRRCHSICSWNDVMTPTTGEAMPTMALET